MSMEIRGYGGSNPDIRAMMGGWTTLASDLKKDLFDDAVTQIAKLRAMPTGAIKLKNVSIDIPKKQTPETSPSKRTVKLTPQVDMVLMSYFSTIDERIIVSRVVGDTIVPEQIFYTNRPLLVPIVLLKGLTYQIQIEVGSNTPTVTDLLLVGVQIGEIPANLVQYTIDADDGVQA